jgi:hypothetical protein
LLFEPLKTRFLWLACKRKRVAPHAVARRRYVVARATRAWLFARARYASRSPAALFLVAWHEVAIEIYRDADRRVTQATHVADDANSHRRRARVSTCVSTPGLMRPKAQRARRDSNSRPSVP